MADVDMTDAPGSTAVASKKKGGDVEGKSDSKKRFEVKKVNTDIMFSDYDSAPTLLLIYPCTTLVERRRTLGMGHCC